MPGKLVTITRNYVFSSTVKGRASNSPGLGHHPKTNYNNTVRIPRSIHINGSTWTVRLVKGFNKKTGYLGMFQRDKKIITIDADQSREDQEITFVHEILHAVWPDGIVGDRTEEKIINTMDKVFYEVLIKNKLT